MCATIAVRISGGVGAIRNNSVFANQEGGIMKTQIEQQEEVIDELIEKNAKLQIELNKRAFTKDSKEQLVQENAELRTKLREAEDKIGELNRVVAGQSREIRRPSALYLT